jgi:hypothetical protein
MHMLVLHIRNLVTMHGINKAKNSLEVSPPEELTVTYQEKETDGTLLLTLSYFQGPICRQS